MTRFDIQTTNQMLKFVKSRPIRLPLKTAPFGSLINTRKLNFSSLSPTPLISPVCIDITGLCFLVDK